MRSLKNIRKIKKKISKKKINTKKNTYRKKKNMIGGSGNGDAPKLHIIHNKINSLEKLLKDQESRKLKSLLLNSLINILLSGHTRELYKFKISYKKNKNKYYHIGIYLDKDRNDSSGPSLHFKLYDGYPEPIKTVMNALFRNGVERKTFSFYKIELETLKLSSINLAGQDPGEASTVTKLEENPIILLPHEYEYLNDLSKLLIRS